MHRYNRGTIQAITAEHRKMRLLFVLYGALGAVYPVIWFIWGMKNHHSLKTQAQVVFFLGICIVVFIMFWIAPIMDFCRQKKSYENKKRNLDILQIMADAANNGPTNWLTRKSNYGILFMVALCVTLLFQSAYLLLWSKIVIKTGDSAMDYVVALFILVLYQYGVQRGLAHLLKKVINWFDLSKYVGQFMQDDVLYQLLKNATYLSYILVNISECGGSFTSSVIGTLFLFDTFFDKRDCLIKRLERLEKGKEGKNQ